MIDYELTQDEKKLQTEMAQFAASEIAPRAMALDGCSRTEVGEFVRENLRKLGQANLLAAGLNGERLAMVSHYVAGEELAKACASTYLAARSSIFLCGATLNLYGSAAQKERYLPGLKQASLVGALAYSEEEAGSDLKDIATTAERRGDSWVLNGEKNLVLNAPIADILLVLAKSEKGAEGGMSLFIVEKVAKGLTIGEPLDTMGVRGAPVASLSLTDCEALAIVGDTPGNGLAQVCRVLELGRIGVAALCVGIGSACMEKATQHAKSKKASGRTIGKFQEVGFKLADMFTNNDLGRTLALRAAWAFDHDEPEAEIIASCAKLFAGEGATKVANWAMQIFAGHGYLKGTDIERLYRDARFGEIYEGTTEVQRTIIAGNELDKFVQR